jgi:hypothetical protein
LSNTVAAGSREVGKVLGGASRDDSIALRGISSPILLAPPKLVSTSNKPPVGDRCAIVGALLGFEFEGKQQLAGSTEEEKVVNNTSYIIYARPFDAAHPVQAGLGAAFYPS